MIFKWDEEDRLDFLLETLLEARIQIDPKKRTATHAGAIFGDRYLKNLNLKRLQTCLEGCNEGDCKDPGNSGCE